MNKVVYKKRSPILALILSFLTFGLGQLYNGQPKKAIALYVAGFLTYPVLFRSNISCTFSGLIFFLVIILVVILVAVFDAWRSAAWQRYFIPKKYNRWYLYLAVILVNGLMIAPIIDAVLPAEPIKAYKIPSGAMIPALLVGDHIMVDLRAYENGEPVRGDIIVFQYPIDPEKDFIKRVIGLPGEFIEIKDDKIFINGKILEDEWGMFSTRNMSLKRTLPFGQAEVPLDSYYVMGDNRDNSHDSRFWGFVPKSSVKGKALYVYFSKQLSRIGLTIQ